MAPETAVLGRRLTSEDLERTPPPIEGGGYELDEGELVYVCPNSLKQGEVIYKFYAVLRAFVKRRKLGLVTPDAWIELSDGTVRAPDVAFIPADRAAGLDPAHTLKATPVLAAEVLGPWDKPRDLLRKIRQYQDAGVKLVLVLDPDRREIDVYPQDRPMYTLTAEDTFEAPDILPGFSVRVGKLFE
jgi:Uma2 family endonuclease